MEIFLDFLSNLAKNALETIERLSDGMYGSCCRLVILSGGLSGGLAVAKSGELVKHSIHIYNLL